MNSTIDDDLIRRATAGDRSALDELHSRLLPRLHAAARLRMGPLLRQREGSMDVVLSACGDVLRKDLPRFDSSRPHELIAWFFQALNQKIADKHNFYLRLKRDARRDVAVDDELALEGCKTFCSPSESANKRETLVAIKRNLDRLPPDQRQAVLLAKLAEWPYREIATEQGCSLSLVKMRVTRGLAKLRSFLIEEGFSNG